MLQAIWEIQTRFSKTSRLFQGDKTPRSETTRRKNPIDLEMIRELGYCFGNRELFSLSRRKITRNETFGLDYFPKII
jgi:excinuclease UvrABC helicase subunit UvrB